MSDVPPWGDRGQPSAGQPGYGPPGHGQPGYGPPGYGPPGQQAPPPLAVPAPGGVPLRPMAVGDILSGAFTLIRRNPGTILGLAAIIVTINQIVTAIVTAYITGRLPAVLFITPGQQATSSQANSALASLGRSLPAIFGLEIGGLLLVILFRGILTGMLTGAMGRGVLGRKVGIGPTVRDSRLGTVLAVAFLTLAIFVCLWAVPLAIVVALAIAGLPVVAAIAGCLGAIAAVVLTVWLYVTLSLAMPAAVLERLGPVAALSRSWHLARGSFWRLLGILLLASLVVSVTAGLLTAPVTLARLAAGGPFSFISTGHSIGWLIATTVAGIIAGTVTSPIAAGVNVLLYTDMRMRKEGMDLVLQQVAARHERLDGDEFATVWRPTAASQSAYPGFGTPGPCTPGYGSPGNGTPGLGTPGNGMPGLGTPGLGTPGLGTSGSGMPGGGAQDGWPGSGGDRSSAW
ncbi:MAG TPA: hypothetical protein VN840_01350 [Streptosporangiaceae bacterium]|nr:hypothetical protein [Streptosporangiaceae bacterium]